MNPAILKLHPTEYFCPHCGEWHKIIDKVPLDSINLKLACEHHPNFDNAYKVFFSEGKICTYVITPCHKFDFYVQPHRGAVNISEFKEFFDGTTPTIKLPIVVVLQGRPHSEENCKICSCFEHCQFKDKDKYVCEYFFETQIAFRFDANEYHKHVLENARESIKGILKDAGNSIVNTEAYSKVTTFAEDISKKFSELTDEASKKFTELTSEISDIFGNILCRKNDDENDSNSSVTTDGSNTSDTDKTE